MENLSGVLCCFLFTFFVSFILQTVGFFTPNWVTWKGCEEQGLFGYSTSNTTNECIGDGDYINTAALGLQATSFGIHLLVILTSLWLMCCGGNDDVGCCGCCAGCSIMKHVSWVLSIVGCGMMSTIDVPEFSYGYSFDLCLASGIYVMIQAILACCCISKLIKDGGDYDDQQQHIAVVVAEREERALSNGVTILRKLRITQVVGLAR